MEQVERWAHFVKENPAKWKKSHTEFINALFEKHYSFRSKLLQTSNGGENYRNFTILKTKKDIAG